MFQVLAFLSNQTSTNDEHKKFCVIKLARYLGQVEVKFEYQGHISGTCSLLHSLKMFAEYFDKNQFVF